MNTHTPFVRVKATPKFTLPGKVKAKIRPHVVETETETETDTLTETDVDVALDTQSNREWGSMGGAQTFTITFGECAENHAGMQKIGSLAKNGLSLKNLRDIHDLFTKFGCHCALTDLGDVAGVDCHDAAILIVRNAAHFILGGHTAVDALFQEHANLDHDTKAKMYGRVVNKIARHNLCFDHLPQDPDYEHGMGRIVPFSQVPFTAKIKKYLDELLQGFGVPCDLKAEGNYYYDIRKCGIGFHGDAERKIVVALRLGHDMDLHFQWYHHGQRIGRRILFPLSHGDVYFLSDKAVGHDWKKKITPTLRHAAGAPKFTQ